MKLTLEKAREMLEEARKKSTDDRWINHSICVGNTAGKIAEKLNLDINYAKTLGYIHDIGRAIGDGKDHVMNGYNYIKELGYDDEYANICLTHSYLNNDVYCTAGGFPKDIPFRTEFIKNHEYTIYEKILNLCELDNTGHRGYNYCISPSQAKPTGEDQHEQDTDSRAHTSDRL